MAIAIRLAVAINATSREVAQWYETESLVIGADETEVVRQAAKALNIGRGKELDDIAADDEVMLSVMSALFDLWFGFIFWGVAFFRMRSADLKVGQRNSPVVDWMGILVNLLLIFTGFFFLSVGTYASVQGIIDAYDAGTVRGVFSCASNGI
ncbi:hypothetical protein NM208_g3279 [Fusarium decemcellulare]|uniref:Uncharacterized protein n=1 Tax=Fusarium decemcellulare TaxID=57161 RepID=A0ACC1SPJ3_9HYPO|nr:hypothetical protein NM208_g3279 [Fusarium decemcellulare]